MDALCSLAVEHWRVSRIYEQSQEIKEWGSLRHSVRRMGQALKDACIEIIDLQGRPYDPGMAPDVVETCEHNDPCNTIAVIEETVSPTVLWRGRVIEPGKIVVSCATTNFESSGAEK